MLLSMQVLTEVTDTIPELMLSVIFNESAKLCHHISTGLQIEIIDNRFYEEITQRMIKDDRHLEPEEVDIDVTKYIPAKKDRRVSVITPGQHMSKRESFHKNAATAGLLRDFQQGAGAAIAGDFHRPSTTDNVNLRYGYLLKVLALRSKSGTLLQHSFPSLYYVMEP